MALSATFTANFSSFYAAVDKAEVKLKDFAGGAAKAGAGLDRMTQQFSGQKVVQEATLMVKAIGGVEGITKLTEKEMARLGATTNEAVEKLKRLGKEIPPDLQKVANATKTVTTQASVLNTTWAKLTSAFAVGSLIDRGLGAITQGFERLVQFMGDSVLAAIDAEKAHSRMVGALEAQNVALPGVIKHYDALATRYQKFTKFNDDTIREAITTLTQIGQVAPKQMDAALKATTDLASALQLELPQAAEMVSRAIEGNVTAFKKMGIELDAAKVKAEGADYIFEKINERFGGAAQRDLTTYAGKLEALANQWDDFQEDVGQAIIDTGALQTGIVLTSIAIQQLGRELKGLGVLLNVFEGSGSYLLALASALGVTTGRIAPAKVPFNKDAFGMASSHTDVDRATADMLAQQAKDLADKLAAEAALKAQAAAQKIEAAYQAWKRGMIGLSDEARRLNDNLKRLAHEGYTDVVAKTLTINDELPAFIRQTAVSAKELTKMGEAAFDAAQKLKAVQAVQKSASLIKPTDWGKLLGGAVSGNPDAVRARADAIADMLRFNQELSTAARLIDVVGSAAAGGFRRVMQFVAPAAGAVLEFAKALKIADQAQRAAAVSAVSANTAMAGLTLGFSLAFNSIQANQQQASDSARAWREQVHLLNEEFGLTADEFERIKAAHKGSIGPGLLLQIFRQAQQAIGGLRDLTTAFGGVVPQSLRPMVDEILRMQNLPQGLRDQLGAFAEAPAWQTLQQRAEALGIEMSALGGGFNQKRLASLGFGFFHDIEMFMEQGADLDGLLRGMSDELSRLAGEALKTGTILPKSLEPYMKRLQEMGLLVDENGNAINDLSFADMEDESLKAVVAVLEQIRELLAKALPQAAATFGAAADQHLFRERTGASSTLDGAGSAWAPAAAGAGGMMTVVVEADGRTLSRIVAPYLPDEVRRLGLARG